MDELQFNWLRERATRLDSCVPDVPLSVEERDALDRIVGSARVVGLGEMTHGSREIARARHRLVRALVQDYGFNTFVLETCFGATRALGEAVTSANGALPLALAETGYWSCANAEMLEFAQWLRSHNLSVSSPQRQVRLFGCDVQSIDGAKKGLRECLERFRRTGQISSEAQAGGNALISALPTDAALQRQVQLLVEELSAPNPSEATLVAIQARQAEYLTTVHTSVDRVVHRLGEMGRALAREQEPEERFFFVRCIRLLEQVFEYSAPDFRKRDAFMAENVRALLNFLPESKVVLLFANIHVSRIPLVLKGAGFEPMGAVLAAELKEAYRAVGSAFHHGEYFGVTGTKRSEDQIVQAHLPRASAFEAVLNEFGESNGTPDYLVKLNAADASPFPFPEGLEMNLGEAGGPQSYEATFVPQKPQLQYDGLVFVTRSSPITVLPQYYEHAQQQWPRP